MSNIPPKIAYSLDELEALGCGCRSSLYEHINSGELKAVKAGRRTLVLREDLESWLGKLPKIEPKSIAEDQPSADPNTKTPIKPDFSRGRRGAAHADTHPKPAA